MAPRTPDENRRIREETRGKILDAAEALFSERGFRGTTMAAVAREAGVSKGLAYHYFAAKEDLLEEIVVERLEGALRPVETAGDETSAIEVIERVVDGALERARARPEATRLWLSLVLQPESVAVVLRAKQRLAPRLARWQGRLERALEDLGVADPRGESYFLSAAINGVLLTWLAAPDVIPLEPLRERLLEPYLGDSE